jgi:hypothetical protein
MAPFWNRPASDTAKVLQNRKDKKLVAACAESGATALQLELALC